MGDALGDKSVIQRCNSMHSSQALSEGTILYTEEYDDDNENDKAAYSSVQQLGKLPLLPRDKRTVVELYETIDRIIFVTPKK